MAGLGGGMSKGKIWWICPGLMVALALAFTLMGSFQLVVSTLLLPMEFESRTAV
jgi:hypothetical protein